MGHAPPRNTPSPTPEITPRARTLTSRLPGDVVAMQSTVKFVDEASGVERTLQLVYPQAADIEAERISILSLVGAGLLGLRTGQSIMWPDRAGKQRLLRIVDVVHV
ncbi:GreA/GreB family elongation factor [Accumulibacter sp.]|uniref:GreA/GreB family elongation factor n=1 Tax=Accumulibacter sp. TaxID=2053492 RepID=UPI001DA2B909|nr:GreA/GreB family elongation factor [Sphingomonadaceae bacterium]MCP5227008.1 GreA/GreB family elongation factor [Accumulibacter sp.]